MRTRKHFQPFLAAVPALAAAAAIAACSGGHGIMPVQTTAQSDGGSALSQATIRRPRGAASCPKPYPGGVPMVLSNLSGLPTTDIYLYALQSGQASYLGADGAIHAWSSTYNRATAFPMSCFPGSLGQKGAVFTLPPAVSARVYIAFSKNLTITQSDQTPQGWEKPGNPKGYENPNYAILWDFFEYSQNGAGTTIDLDTTQVDGFGLPIGLQVSPSTVKEVGTNNYAKIFAEMKAAGPFNVVIEGAVGNVKVPLRILSPKDALSTCGGCEPASNFPTDYLVNKKYYPSDDAGYLGAVLKFYATANDPKSKNYHKLFFPTYQVQFNGNSCNAPPTPAPSGGTRCPVYVAYAVGNAFIFQLKTPVPTPSPNPTGAPTPTPIPCPATVKITANQLTTTDVFAEPAAAPAATDIPGSVAFYLLKTLTEDLNRGVAMEQGIHPVIPTGGSGCPNWASCGAVVVGATNYYPKGQLFNTYSQVMHANLLQRLAYGFPFDDSYNQSTLITSSGAPTKVTVIIGKMLDSK